MLLSSGIFGVALPRRGGALRQASRGVTGVCEQSKLNESE